MTNFGRMGIHYLHKLNAATVPTELIEKGQNRVIEASLTLIRERVKLKIQHGINVIGSFFFPLPQGELIRAMGGAVASASLLGVPLGHNSSFLQGPAFAPPHIREAIWCGSTNSTTEEGKELNDPWVLTDVGDVPVQEIQDCGVDDDKLMNTITESVKLVMEEIYGCNSNAMTDLDLQSNVIDDFMDTGFLEMYPLRPLVLGGDHSISYPVIRAVSEKLGGPLDILHLDAHPDIYHAFEGNKYSHASSFARIMEGGYGEAFARRPAQTNRSEGPGRGRSKLLRRGDQTKAMTASERVLKRIVECAERRLGRPSSIRGLVPRRPSNSDCWLLAPVFYHNSLAPSHPMANPGQVPDLEGLHREIHDMAEQMRIMNENNGRLMQLLAAANPPLLAASPVPDIERSCHSLIVQKIVLKISVPTESRRGRSLHRGDHIRARDKSTSQKIRDLDARLDAINTGTNAPVTVDTLIRQTEPPFTGRVLRARISSKFKLPTQLGIYEGKTDPMDHLDSYKSMMLLQGCSDESTLRRQFHELQESAEECFSLFTVHQKETESLKDFVKRFNQAILEVEDPSDKSKVDKYIAAEELAEAKRRRRGKDDHKRKEPDIRRNDYREETRYKRPDRDPKRSNNRRPRTPPRRPEFILPSLNAPVAQVLSEIKHEEFVKWPGKIKTDPQKRNRNKYCEFYRDHGHNTEDCFQLKEQIADLIKRGYLRKYVVDRPPPNSPERRYGDNRLTAGNIQTIHGGFGSGGYSTSSRKRHARSAHKLAEEEIYNLSSSFVADQTPITFSNDDLRGLHLPHDDALVVSAVIANFNVQRILIDNGSSADILFISAFEKMKIGLDKLHPFHTPLIGFGGNTTHPLGWINLPITLGTEPHHTTVWQDFIVVDCPSPYNAILGRPTLGGIKAITSTYHLKSDILGIDPKIAVHKLFTDPKYSPIRQKRRKFAPERLKVIEDEIKMYPPDIEKTFFIIERGLYCYKVMPFGLKNAGVTYQRLVNKMFKEQIGKTMEVYIDDMLVKSLLSSDHIAHLEEAFSILRRHRMMLNPSKCIFGVSFGKFLGFLVTKRGIEVNPDQIQALTVMSSPRNIREVQQLTGRVAALNRFVSKSADNISGLCLYSVPTTGEDLYIYLSISPTAVSVVLIREEDQVQRPIYYVSKVLIGAEARYPKIEKLAYALMIAARKLRHYFQAHPIIVLTDEPLKHILQRPDTSAQALVDFIVESTHEDTLQPEIAPPEAGILKEPTSEKDLAHWILFVDGSSNQYGCGAGLVIQAPSGEQMEYAIRMGFKVTNNEAEYEALIAGLRVATELGAQSLEVFSDSQSRIALFSTLEAQIRDLGFVEG
ncbi:arginase [Actinidia rufa]|uniref:RNA-directed DNA polymerase n=1 Tax=Actinidia rufa TaxID=165716 RepID=A0A7J0F3Z5_9ERIC|nr:arginase [Actinidia rufa]